MSHKLKSTNKQTNKGPMDKYIKKKTDNHDGESSKLPEPCYKTLASPGCTSSPAQSQQGSSPCKPLDKQDDELHETHSFEWCSSDKKLTMFTCNKAGTVEDLLKRSSQFKEIAGKNKNKELVIVRDGKAISWHFPCSLIKNERLTVKYVKAVNKVKQSVCSPGRRQRKVLSGELVMFHVLTKGGEKVVNIMGNPALKTGFQEITVYARKGETVKQALRRDGRFLNTIFKKNCVLSHASTEVTTEMSNLVDDLDGKTFKIILLNKSCSPESQSGSLDDAYVESESAIDCNGNQEQSTTAEPVDDNTPKEKAEPNNNKALVNMIREIPNSKKMQCELTLQFRNSVKGMNIPQGSKLSRIQNLLRVEYGKRAQACSEVKTMKKLMSLSDSVCQVRINGRPGGSGFLLFGRFVLTNAHVVKNIYNENSGSLNETLTVHFSFESLDQMDSGVLVEEVVGYENCQDESGHMYDWALLRLDADQTLPDVLLKRFGFLPQSGGICIIGHPAGGVKKIDACLVIPTESLGQVLRRHRNENPEGVQPFNHQYSENQEPIQLVTDRFFEDVSKDKSNRQALSYESCFYFGSSGSPVFDEHCNVVAMHSAGYAYLNARGEMQSVIEFGYPLSIIIKHIIVQMVERRRCDVLKEYLACEYKHHQNMIANLKEMVESRNLQVFKKAANDLLAIRDDENLKMFFGFFCQREELEVPMETD